MRAHALVLVAVLALAGCAGTRPYSSEAPKNLAVRAQLERGVKVSLHVHRVDAACRTEYLGTVALDGPSAEVALPADAFSYLVVSFDTSSFFGGDRSSSVGTPVRPRPGQRLELAVSYRDDVYDVALRDLRTGRELARRDLVTCGAG